MTWVDIIWPALGGVSLALGLLHLLIWLRQRNQPALLMFTLAAGAVSMLAIFELLLMRAQTPQQYAALLRWGHLPVAILAIALVGFVLLHFRAGRAWIGWTACALRVAITLPGLLSGGSLRFRQITELQPIELWGGVMVATPIGTASPWVLFAQIADLLLVLFLVDTIMAVWRRTRDRDERRRVLLVCGSMIAFVVLTSGWSMLVAFGWLQAPLGLNLPFLAVLLVMSYELGGSVIRAAMLEKQLRETESSLRGSEQRFRFTADAVGIGLWNWHVDERKAWLTEAGSALLGVEGEGRIDADSFLARVSPLDREIVARARDEALQRTGNFQCEFRMSQPDGSLRWLAATGRVEPTPAGSPSLLRGVVLDITRQRQAEERFRLVVEYSPTAILMIDGNGAIALANTQAERVFGYSNAELLDLDIDTLVPSLARPQRSREPIRTPGDKPVIARDLSGCHKDGGRVPIEVALNPIRIADDLYSLASIIDISERLRYEKELALQRSELAHLSRITLLGEMSGSLAHELNQPLTAVLSNAQAALRFLDRETPDLVEVRESLVQIVENDKRAGEVIRRLRAMLRKDPVDHQALQINDVVQDVIRMVSNDLLNRSVSVSLDLAPGLPAVNGDPVQLQQVLLNVVINACDAMGDLHGGRALAICTGRAPDGIRIDVSDVGRGIPEEDLERIFEAFVSTKREGMGLGLTVCRTIIQAHRGTLWATRNTSAGATFHVLLPLAEVLGGESESASA
ncbi:PAS domain S-box-containing protein [Luteimonas cucumeris]|uniref:histidine kinase n=1 Tax=Luteimonas cucumeris TaxID=985012 RepID=A0A562L7D3_9GAMM|nr:PAS domain S-box protein [Luteimonas cucumeris]TWI03543.1 PAS domain S-box-containing protein [Luteimonas cucumeris]